MRALKRHELVFGTGPAGTGKTWLAVAHAVALFERKEVDRIILSRPAVEAGERLGFLPGDMREKVDPYLRPIYDALFDLMDARIVERAMQSGETVFIPDAANDPSLRHVKGELINRNVKSITVVPITWRSVAIGAISISPDCMARSTMRASIRSNSAS